MGYVTTILVLLTAIFAVSAYKSCMMGEKLLMLMYGILAMIFFTIFIRAKMFSRKKDHRRKKNDQ